MCRVIPEDTTLFCLTAVLTRYNLSVTNMNAENTEGVLPSTLRLAFFAELGVTAVEADGVSIYQIVSSWHCEEISFLRR